MAGMSGVPLPSALLLAFGGIFVWFGVRAYRTEDVVGRRWFVALMAAELVWAAGYGVQLLVTDPETHLLVAAVAETGAAAVPAVALLFFLVFAGQERYVRPLTVMSVLLVPAVSLFGHLTQDSLGLLYTDYRLVTTGGVTTLVGDGAILETVVTVCSLTLIAASAGVLFWTVYRYWSLYRQHVPWLAVLYGTTLVAFTLHATGNAPIQGLRLVPFTAPLQAVVFANLLFRNEFLGISSRTRSIGRKSAMQALEDGVAIVDEDWRLADCNPMVEEVFGTGDRPVGTPLAEILGSGVVEGLRSGETVTVRPDGGRTLEATATDATDQHDEVVGHVVLLRDVTELQRRGQRLSVLNRVMRHNVRNEMTIVEGNARLLEERVDGEPAEFAARIRDSAADVVALGEKARSLEEVLDEDEGTRRADVTRLTREVVDGVATEYPEVAFSTTGRETPLRTRPAVLQTVLRTVVDNAAEHNDAADPRVETSVERDDDAAVVVVSDNGPGIPAAELSVLDADEETDLDHGSGLGLWLVRWGVEQLGGSVTFETDDGTTVRIRVPDRPSGGGSGAAVAAA